LKNLLTASHKIAKTFLIKRPKSKSVCGFIDEKLLQSVPLDKQKANLKKLGKKFGSSLKTFCSNPKK